ncbi:MAG: hypothetical protein EBR71_10860, partial [Planctomycetes bacterium]|nr:hypothetical protein [Planctomycetota bacterium]
MARKLRQKIGEMLIANKVATDDKVKEAIDMAKSTGKRVGEVLIEMGVCSEEDVARALAAQFGMEFLNLERAEDNARIDMSLIKEEIIKKHVVLPLSKTGRLKVLIHDPMDLELLDMLRFRLNAEIDTAIASRRQISYYIEGDRKGAAVAQAQAPLLSDSMDVSVDKSVDKSMDKSIDIDASEEAPMVKLVNRIILEGVLGRASDIHVEPMKDYVLVRYRIDGVCVVRDKLPKRNQPAILARFKL